MVLLPATAYLPSLPPPRRPNLVNPSSASLPLPRFPPPVVPRCRRENSRTSKLVPVHPRALLDPQWRSPNPHLPPQREGAAPLAQVVAPVIFFFAAVGAASSACAVGSSTAPNPPTASATAAAIESSGSASSTEQTTEEVNEELEREFESWKSKTFALTVPLRIVALRGSFPASWVKDFMQSQGKRVKLRPEFYGSLQYIYNQLALASKSASIDSRSVMASDIVSVGDAWFSHAIQAGLIEPIHGAEDQDWFNDLGDLWKIYLRRNDKGELESSGRIWGAPYRWGTMVIAYKKDKFKKHGLAAIEDWGDLWRPELSGKISMIASPREVVGAVLKYMGASYNTEDIDSQVVGGRSAVMQNLELLQRQVRLFDNVNYLKAFTVGDAWVAVGWSSDVISTAKRMSNVAVVAPKSGSSLWADIWAVPAATKCNIKEIGGRIRSPSPLIHQWIAFCLQPARVFAFQQEVIPGAAPTSLDSHSIGSPRVVATGTPMMDTNLISGVPPPEILTRSEFLEPLSEKALSDFQWLVGNMQKPHHGWVSWTSDQFTSLFKRLNVYLNLR